VSTEQPPPGNDDPQERGYARTSNVGDMAVALAATKEIDHHRRGLATRAYWTGLGVVVVTLIIGAISLYKPPPMTDDTAPWILSSKALLLLTGVLFGYALVRFAERMARPLYMEQRRGRPPESVLQEAADLLRPLTDQLLRAYGSFKKQ
jgi:hypothetical protein